MKSTDPRVRAHFSQRNIVWTVVFSLFFVVTWNACDQAIGLSDDASPDALTPTGDARLSTLTVTDGLLLPTFSSEVAHYTMNVAASTASVTVTAAAQDPGDSVSIDSQTTTNLLVPLNEAGADSTISIVVTAPNGNRNTYVVKVMRDAVGANNRLQSLSVSPGSLAPAFDPSAISYTVDVADTVDRIMVAAQAQDAGASVSIQNQTTTSRSVPLGPAGGPTSVLITVTAPNHSQKIVTVRVNRAARASGAGACGTTCLVPENWDFAWTHGLNGYTTSYVRDLAEEMSKKMYPPISNWNNVVQGYLSPKYSNYSTLNYGYSPPMYRRHVGWDNGRPDNTPVYSITTGQVTFRQYVPNVGYNNVIIIREKKNGVFQDRWWTYGHIEPSSGITVGTDVTEGQQVGTIDEYDGFPHIHLSVHSTNWQADIVDPTPPVEWGQHWGIARGLTQPLAESTATSYTLHPIHAYALYQGYDVTR